MGNTPAFQFYPRQWLSDDCVMIMSWEARGFHIHLMCIAWQADDPCTIPNDTRRISRWAGMAEDSPAFKTLFDEVFESGAWDYDADRDVWVQQGLLREFTKQEEYRAQRRDAARARWDKQHKKTTPRKRRSASKTPPSTVKFGDGEASPEAIFDEHFWPVYPKRKGSNPKATAKAKFVRLVTDAKTPVCPAAIIAGVKKYAAAERENINSPFIAQAVTWLNQRRWEDEYDTKSLPGDRERLDEIADHFTGNNGKGL